MLNELKNLLLDAVHAIGDLPDLLFRLATRPIAWGFAWIQGILHPDTRPRRNSMATVPKVRRNLAPLKQTLQRLSKGSRQGGQNSSKFLAQSGSSLRAKGQGIWNQTLRPLGKVTSTGLRTGFSVAGRSVSRAIIGLRESLQKLATQSRQQVQTVMESSGSIAHAVTCAPRRKPNDAAKNKPGLGTTRRGADHRDLIESQQTSKQERQVEPIAAKNSPQSPAKNKPAQAKTPQPRMVDDQLKQHSRKSEKANSTKKVQQTTSHLRKASSTARPNTKTTVQPVAEAQETRVSKKTHEPITSEKVRPASAKSLHVSPPIKKARQPRDEKQAQPADHAKLTIAESITSSGQSPIAKETKQESGASFEPQSPKLSTNQPSETAEPAVPSQKKAALKKSEVSSVKKAMRQPEAKIDASANSQLALDKKGAPKVASKSNEDLANSNEAPSLQETFEKKALSGTKPLTNWLWKYWPSKKAAADDVKTAAPTQHRRNTKQLVSAQTSPNLVGAALPKDKAASNAGGTDRKIQPPLAQPTDEQCSKASPTLPIQKQHPVSGNQSSKDLAGTSNAFSRPADSKATTPTAGVKKQTVAQKISDPVASKLRVDGQQMPGSAPSRVDSKPKSSTTKPGLSDKADNRKPSTPSFTPTSASTNTPQPTGRLRPGNMAVFPSNRANVFAKPDTTPLETPAAKVAGTSLAEGTNRTNAKPSAKQSEASTSKPTGNANPTGSLRPSQKKGATQDRHKSKTTTSPQPTSNSTLATPQDSQSPTDGPIGAPHIFKPGQRSPVQPSTGKLSGGKQPSGQLPMQKTHSVFSNKASATSSPGPKLTSATGKKSSTDRESSTRQPSPHFNPTKRSSGSVENRKPETRDAAATTAASTSPTKRMVGKFELLADDWSYGRSDLSWWERMGVALAELRPGFLQSETWDDKPRAAERLITVSRFAVLTSVGLLLTFVLIQLVNHELLVYGKIIPVFLWMVLGMTAAAAVFSFPPARWTLMAVWLIAGFALGDSPQNLIRYWLPVPTTTADSSSSNPLAGVTTTAAQIRVVSFNCKGSPDAVAELQGLNADVILLQESINKKALQETVKLYLPDYQAVWGGDTSVLVRGTVEPIENVPKKTARRCKLVRATLNKGQQINLASVHLIASPRRADFWLLETWQIYADLHSQRRRQLKRINDALLQFSNGNPIIIGGDFNAPARDTIYEVLRPRFRDTWPEAGRGWGKTSLNQYPVHRIDQVWISEELEARSVSAQKSDYSDHRMVICDLVLPGANSPQADEINRSEVQAPAEVQKADRQTADQETLLERRPQQEPAEAQP